MFSVSTAVVKWWNSGRVRSSPARVKQIEFEALHRIQRVWFTVKVWEVVLNADNLDLFTQQVCLVEEQNDGDVMEGLVVDYGLKDAARFH